LAAVKYGKEQVIRVIRTDFAPSTLAEGIANRWRIEVRDGGVEIVNCAQTDIDGALLMIKALMEMQLETEQKRAADRSQADASTPPA
jgi:hypothetical protein